MLPDKQEYDNHEHQELFLFFSEITNSISWPYKYKYTGEMGKEGLPLKEKGETEKAG